MPAGSPLFPASQSLQLLGWGFQSSPALVRARKRRRRGIHYPQRATAEGHRLQSQVTISVRARAGLVAHTHALMERCKLEVQLGTTPGLARPQTEPAAQLSS